MSDKNEKQEEARDDDDGEPITQQQQDELFLTASAADNLAGVNADLLASVEDGHRLLIAGTAMLLRTAFESWGDDPEKLANFVLETIARLIAVGHSCVIGSLQNAISEGKIVVPQQGDTRPSQAPPGKKDGGYLN